MDTENIILKMVQFMKDIGLIINSMEKETKFYRITLYIMVLLSMAKRRVY